MEMQLKKYFDGLQYDFSQKDFSDDIFNSMDQFCEKNKNLRFKVIFNQVFQKIHENLPCFQKNQSSIIYLFYQISSYNKFFLQYFMTKNPQMSIKNCFLSFNGQQELHSCQISFIKDNLIKIQKKQQYNINREFDRNLNLVQNNLMFNLKINLTLRFNATFNDFYMKAINKQMIQILLKDRQQNEEIKLYVTKNQDNYKKIYHFLKLTCFIKGFNKYFYTSRTQKFKLKDEYFIVQQKIKLENRMVNKFSKQDFNDHLQDRLLKQIGLQKKVQSRNILHHYGYFEDDTNFYIVYQEVSIKTLRQFFVDSGHIDKPLIQLIMKQMLEALLQLQIKGILHNQIRMSTIKLVKDVKNQQNQQIRFCLDQFSASIDLSELKKADLKVSKYYGYSAPEVINPKLWAISHKSDIFMLGIVFYQLLIGRTPFDLKSLYQNPYFIDSYPQIDFECGHSNKISFQAKQLLQKMLQFDVKKRISVTEALSHRYFTVHQSLTLQEMRKQILESNIKIMTKNQYLDQKRGYKNEFNLKQNQSEELVHSHSLKVGRSLKQKQNIEKIHQTVGKRAQQMRKKIKFQHLRGKKRVLQKIHVEGEIDSQDIDDTHIDLQPKNISIMTPSYEEKKNKSFKFLTF